MRENSTLSCSVENSIWRVQSVLVDGDGKAGTATNLLKTAQIQASPAPLKTWKIGDRHSAARGLASEPVTDFLRGYAGPLGLRYVSRGACARNAGCFQQSKPVPVFPACGAPSFQQSKSVPELDERSRKAGAVPGLLGGAGRHSPSWFCGDGSQRGGDGDNKEKKRR